MSSNFALAQKENKSFTTCKDQSERPVQINMHVIFYINVILNNSQTFLMQVYEKSYNACTQLHANLLPLQYSNFCLSRQWASLYSQCYYFQNANVKAEAFSSPKQTILHSIGIRMKLIRNSIASHLFYQHTPIYIAIYKYFVCYNYKTKYTD